MNRFKLVIIYSIIILSSSDSLITTNFANYILFCFAILFPSLIMIGLIKFFVYLSTYSGKLSIALKISMEQLKAATEKKKAVIEKLKKKKYKMIEVSVCSAVRDISFTIEPKSHYPSNTA